MDPKKDDPGLYQPFDKFGEYFMKKNYGRLVIVLATFLIFLYPVDSNAGDAKYRKFKVDGQPLTNQERFVLEKVEAGEEANILAFLWSLHDWRAMAINQVGLPDYLTKLESNDPQTKENFLENNGDKLKIRARFLEILLTEGFPGLKINRKGVIISNSIVVGILDLVSAEITYTCALKQCLFVDNVYFSSSLFKKSLSLQGSHFLNEADFNAIDINKTFILKKTTFLGSVDFTGANIGGEFNAMEAKFLNEKEKANFNSINIGNHANFQQTEFRGPVIFCGAKIIGYLNAIMSKFFQSANFYGMKVGHSANFEKVEFLGPVDLRSCNIQSLLLGEVNFPNIKPYWVDLEGLYYNTISAGTDNKSWKILLDIVNNSRYHSQPYSQLETYFKESGYQDHANDVFISRKRRELTEEFSWRKPWQWPTMLMEKIVLDLGVGYGRYPERAVYFSIFFILLGTVVFSRSGVLERKGDEKNHPIKLGQAFWFSFDSFMPVINLGPGDLFKVLQDKRLILLSNKISINVITYYYIHQLMGYLLITVGIAAVTGLIK